MSCCAVCLLQINKLLAVIPRERNTYLFSATMTSKVAKLQRASLRDPVKIEVAHRFTTPKTLVQQYLFIPAKYKVSFSAILVCLLSFQSQKRLALCCDCSTDSHCTDPCYLD